MEYLDIVSMPMKRILSYMMTHLAFDMTYVVTGNNGSLDEADYKSSKFKKDKAQFEDFLDNFDWHGQFRRVLKQMLRNETVVVCPRDDGDKLVLQELPLDRCKITGRWDYGFLINFDFSYFLQAGVDIRFFPKFFRDKFNELFIKDKDGRYVPPVDPKYRGNPESMFAYWVDLPPDVAWVFKMDESLVTSIPYFSGLMPELLEQPLMRELQKNANMAAASRMILGSVPMRPAKTNVRDMIAIDAKTLGQFLAIVKSAISESVKVAAAPLENMKDIQFKSENDLYNSYLKTSLSSSGMNSAIFYTGNLKANTVETQLSFQSDSKIMEALYSQFQLFMEYMSNKEIKWHHFYPIFEGNDYYLDRKERFDYAMEMAQLGIVLPQKIAASRGMKPHNLERMMVEAKANGFVDLLTPITPAFNTPKDAGRPQKSDSDLSDKGEGSRGEGANLSRGGNV